MVVLFFFCVYVAQLMKRYQEIYCQEEELKSNSSMQYSEKGKMIAINNIYIYPTNTQKYGFDCIILCSFLN